MAHEKSESWPPPEWIRKKVALEEVYAAWEKTAEELGLSGPAPSWNGFTAKKTDEDELWFFRSDEESWHDFSGREGYAIVRGGKPIAHIITARS